MGSGWLSSRRLRFSAGFESRMVTSVPAYARRLDRRRNSWAGIQAPKASGTINTPHNGGAQCISNPGLGPLRWPVLKPHVWCAFGLAGQQQPSQFQAAPAYTRAMVDAELLPAFLRLARQGSADLERKWHKAFDEPHRLKDQLPSYSTGARQRLNELPPEDAQCDCGRALDSKSWYTDPRGISPSARGACGCLLYVPMVVAHGSPVDTGHAAIPTRARPLPDLPSGTPDSTPRPTPAPSRLPCTHS
jgi:hypothetical protein